MKARINENGEIVLFRSLPSKFRGVTGNYVGGFHRLSSEILEEEGFFDVITPEYNRFTEVLSEIYFDEDENVFTYDVLPKPDLPTVDEAKAKKVEELKALAKEEFNKTDWYYIRELYFDKKGKSKKVPDDVLEKRDKLYAFIDNLEKEILQLSNLEDVFSFKIKFDDLDEQVAEIAVEDEEAVAQTEESGQEEDDVPEGEGDGEDSDDSGQEEQEEQEEAPEENSADSSFEEDQSDGLGSGQEEEGSDEGEKQEEDQADEPADSGDTREEDNTKTEDGGEGDSSDSSGSEEGQPEGSDSDSGAGDGSGE